MWVFLTQVSQMCLWFSRSFIFRTMSRDCWDWLVTCHRCLAQNPKCRNGQRQRSPVSKFMTNLMLWIKWFLSIVLRFFDTLLCEIRGMDFSCMCLLFNLRSGIDLDGFLTLQIYYISWICPVHVLYVSTVYYDPFSDQFIVW